jgi:hypothetical protein
MPGNKGVTDMSVYEIRVQGRLDLHWATWFEGLTLTYEGDCTILRGPLIDEAALHGVLAKVRDLNVRLLAVQILDEEHPTIEAHGMADRAESDSASTSESAQDSSPVDTSGPKPRKKRPGRRSRTNTS